MENIKTISKENWSYIYGILITDGTIYFTERNRGRVNLEIHVRDKSLVEKMVELIPGSSIRERSRVTNFSGGEVYSSVIFVNNFLWLRQHLADMGYPQEDKTNLASQPTVEFSEREYWRGVVDGDGSLGYTGDGVPFLSLVTKSEQMKEEFLELLNRRYNIQKNINRNKRDGVYNIMIRNEEAQDLAKYLYLEGDPTLYLERKMDSAKKMQTWVRTTIKVASRKWTKEEEEFILTHSIQESMEELGRTESSIKNKRFRLTSDSSSAKRQKKEVRTKKEPPQYFFFD